MALITGSTTTDWSTVALQPSNNVQQQFAEFGSTFTHITTEIDARHFTFNGPHTSTFFSLTLTTGDKEIITATGSGFFGHNNPVVKSFTYDNPVTHETMQFSGTIDFVGNEVINRLTVGTLGSTATIIGNIVIDQQGNIVSGNVTQVRETIGSTEVTAKGSLVLSSAGDLSGTVTQISVLSGTDTIVMSGLSVPYNTLSSITTANDLFSVVGNQLSGDDTITYTNNSGAGMTFFGGAGNDTITISGPNGDTLNGGDGNDVLNGGDGNDIINGGAGNDTVTGGAGDDTLNGGAGDDVFLIGAGAHHGAGEVIDGGTGTNVIRFTNAAADTLTLSNGVTGIAEVEASNAAGGNTGTAALNINAAAVTSGLTLTGNAGVNTLTGTALADVLVGNAGNDSIDGGGGDDILDGGLGADSMTGGTGNDTYVIDNPVDSVNEQGGDSNDTVNINRSVDLTFAPFTEIENVVLSGIAPINATGDDGNNLLTGNSAANILNGGAGNDTMDGRGGNDTYLVDSSDDIVTESIAGVPGGVDLVKSSASFDLKENTNVENLTLIGTDNIDGAGNSLNNILTGNGGNNILDGKAGTDKMDGRGGNDTYVVDVATDVVTEAATPDVDTVRSSINYTLGANLENLELTEGANLNGTGNMLNNTLTGNSWNNRLDGGLGQDTVNGGAGDDQITMLVTAGNVDMIDAGTDTDTLVLSGVVPGNHEVVVDLSQLGEDQVVSIGGTADALVQKNFENLNAAGIGSSVRVKGSTGDNVIIGSKGNDWLIGGAGNDTLVGGAGCDSMAGGDGNDTYVVDDLDDRITELFGEGTDTVNINRSADLNLSAFTEIENVLLTGTAAINATGNGGENQLTGNSAANILNGGADNDTLMGGAGNDTLVGGEGDDQLEGGEGNDTYRYGTTLFASEGIDTITDSGGNDLIIINGWDLSGGGFLQFGNDFEAEGPNLEIITIKDQYAGKKIESVQFTGGASMFGYALGSAPYLLNTDLVGHTGGLQNDLIAGSSAGETLNGNGGNDLLFGNGGDDTLNGGAGNDLLVGGFGFTQIDGGDGNDTILAGSGPVTGGAGNDTIVAGSGPVTGGVGDDRIFMDLGNFGTIDAGTGNDTLMLGGFGDVVIDLSKAGDQVTFILGVEDPLVQNNFENLDASGLISLGPPGAPPLPGLSSSVSVTGSNAANILIGSAGNDTLKGGAGNDTLAGGLGDDQLDGGEGNDIFRYDTTTTTILNFPFPPTIVGWGKDTISDSGGSDSLIINGLDLIGETFKRSGDDLVVSDFFNFGITIHNQYAGAKVESLQFTGGASMFGYALGSAPYLLNTDSGHNGGLQNDLIAGTSAGETLTGSGGNDLLFGNGGDDTLNGGAGNDLLVANGNGSTHIDGGDGNDTIVAGSGPVTGGAGDDRIFMDFTNNSVVTIDAGTGNDTLMLGGNGGSVVVHLEAGAGDQVTSILGVPDLLVQNNFENLDASGLDGSITATGNAGANTIIGSDFDDTLNGGAGNDRLDGGAGKDTMDGGAGNDTYVVDRFDDIAAETLLGNGGVDLVRSSASSFALGANVENLTLIGTDNINGTGNSLSNILTGNSGNNFLDGGAGADKMAGGLGDDTYRVDVAGDVVTEALNAGTDKVFSSITYTLGANIEDLQLFSRANVNGTGNALNNVLTGNNGDNLLSGLGGNDTLRGGLGNDTVNGGSGNDTFLFGVGDGQDQIQDNSGCFDTIMFDGGINHENLVISKQANDLRIAIHGSADQITVKNWFVGTTNQTEIIQAGDGQVLVNTQVQQLIDAMAQFSANNNGITWDQAIDQQPAQVQNILAANWQ